MSGKNVLIIGALGYVGKAVSIALRNRGHHVTGVIRNAERSKELLSKEVNVVVAAATEFHKYEKEFNEADVAIVSIQDWTGGETETFKSFFGALKNSNPQKKKVLIYTSGGLVYKPNKDDKLTESSPLTDNPLLQPRINLEKEVLAAKDAYGVVVRPSMIYGGERGHFTLHFQQAEQGKVSVFGNGENVFCAVHIEDLADGYVRIVEANPEVVSGQAFHFADGEKLTTLVIAKVYAAAVGYTGVVETGVAWQMPILDAYVWYGYEKAEKILGWKPTRKSILAEAPILYKAWKASGIPASW